MNSKLEKIIGAFAALVLVACGNTNTAGSTEETNAIADEIDVSSSSVLVDSVEVSSSSVIVLPPLSSGSTGGNNVVVFSFNLWDGSQGMYQVETGLDNGLETSGYWYTFDDGADGGMSKITWPVESGNEYSDDSMDPLIDWCAGVCGTFSLSRGSMGLSPFVALAFNVAGSSDEGVVESADASSWGGLCVRYTSDADMRVALRLADYDNLGVLYNPGVMLPKSDSANVVCAQWSEFKLESDPGFNGDEAVKQLYSIQFVITGESGQTGEFNIMALARYNDFGK